MIIEMTVMNAEDKSKTGPRSYPVLDTDQIGLDSGYTAKEYGNVLIAWFNKKRPIENQLVLVAVQEIVENEK